ncbi:MAG: beta-N-acetylhexosaminidase, partial [Burkholderiales bacterium]|nr:beta-N-acetylhexosaminidase [Burkholderiales bacterium]
AMAGARVAGNVVQAAQAALTAGCDMVLICNQPQQADELLDGLRLEPTAASARRIDGLMPTAPGLSWQALMQEERYLQAREWVRAL